MPCNDGSGCSAHGSVLFSRAKLNAIKQLPISECKTFAACGMRSDCTGSLLTSNCSYLNRKRFLQGHFFRETIIHKTARGS
mmetsp:Transcript_3733/g.7091  ORF Transcript_3733/g.7091 Transcript_3733/m.7091 type:complete len:81 (-) Transcript_3733:94-336(-)